MPPTSIRVYFDFVDPLSYVASHAFERHGGAQGVEWMGFELRPPPLPLTGTADPLWAERWKQAHAWASALHLPVQAPRLVPWTRKAHELHVLAGQKGVARKVRTAVLEAYFVHRLDIGRVDVLVQIGASAGLDSIETKAVLDVDRHEVDIATSRDEARALGVTDVPTLAVDGRLLEAFPDPTGIGTLLPHS